MALNGGVSLAVWMGGCAVEFDAARRAHCGVEKVAVAAAEPTVRQRVTGRVRQFLAGDRPPPQAPASTPSPRTVYAALCDSLNRELVIDIMSGASAGGINGALLAGAIQNGRRLHPDFIRNKWLELGDFSRLLHPTTSAERHALMQGDRFYNDLQTAFEQLVGEQGNYADPRVLTPSIPGAVELRTPSLEVTTTDVLGETREFDDAWGNALAAKRYNARFSFNEAEHFTAHNLAQAARASASFPVAFEPWQVSARAGALAGFDEPRWVVDGGLLDNAPIEAALELIPTRPADSEVRRFVCYVNADPVEPPPEPPGPSGPELPSIIGYVVTLPRKAPFVNQLEAIERATRRSRIGADAGLALLRLRGDALVEAAIELLPAYRRRRRMLSLEELLRQPSQAARAFEGMGEAELPWIPEVFAPDPEDWRWGIRPAERVVHLLLDITRLAISEVGRDQRASLVGARAALGRQVELLESARRRFVDDDDLRKEARKLAAGPEQPHDVLASLDQMTAGYNCEMPSRLRIAGAAAFAVRQELAAALGETASCTALFGDGWDEPSAELDDERFQHLLTSALAVEVVRRAFFAEEDIESGQHLLFAQLTPFTASPIFTSNPFEERGWATPSDKLTGIEVGHFAGFYRRSWRANDFMWGRLDAAARVVEMLVDTARAQELAQDKPWDDLAAALVPDDIDDVQRWLIEEVLERTVAAGQSTDRLRAALAEAIKNDLCIPEADQDPGALTRLVCTRAAQLEVLGHELPILEAEARADTGLGAGTAPLGLDAEKDLKSAIEKLRPGHEALPKRLGRERGELGSSLALRTITHAALVTLAVVRGAKLPLANFIFALRIALLPIAGTVSRAPVYRLGMIVGFWAAALYLAARMLTIDPRVPAEVQLLGSKDTIVALLALFIVLGVAFVPGIRARQPAVGLGGWWRRIVQGLACVLLLASGGVAAMFITGSAADVSWPDVIVAPDAAPDAHDPPEWVLGVAIALLAGPIAAGLLPGGRRVFGDLLARPWGGGAVFGALVAVAIAVGVNSAEVVWPALYDPDQGPQAIAWLALAVAPFTATLYAFVRNPVRRVRQSMGAGS